MSFEYDRAVELCKIRGISIHELCIRSGVPTNTFTKPRRGLGDISIESLKKICEDGLGITIDQFYEPDSRKTTLTDKQKRFLELSSSCTDEQKKRVMVYLRGLAQMRAFDDEKEERQDKNEKRDS